MTDILRPGWNIENHDDEMIVTPRWPKSREEITFLEDQERNEVRVGDRVRLARNESERKRGRGESYGWHFTEGWVVGLSPSFEQSDDAFKPGYYADKLDRRYTTFTVRSDDGIKTGWHVGNTVKVELSEEELAEVLDRAYRHAIRRTEDIIDEYAMWRQKLMRRRAEIGQVSA